jgi:hypothetical protein
MINYKESIKLLRSWEICLKAGPKHQKWCLLGHIILAVLTVLKKWRRADPKVEEKWMRLRSRGNNSRNSCRWQYGGTKLGRRAKENKKN